MPQSQKKGTKMTDIDALAELAAIEQEIRPDLYEQDIDAAADDYEARKRRNVQLELPLDNPWE